LIPQSNGVYKNINPPSDVCNYYTASDTAGTWNGKFSSQGNRLTNAETQNLTFPLPTYLFIHENILYVVNVTAADVDRYYESEKFTVANGYTKISVLLWQ
jgi:hypothetical protein